MKLDVYRDPWITTTMCTGETRKIGLRDCLANAPEIKRVSIPESPMYIDRAMPFILLQMLVTRVYRPDMDAKLDLFEAGKFDMTAIDAYVADCEEAGVSFDVFDDERPFLQFEKKDVDKQKIAPVSSIIPCYPSGNNQIFFGKRMWKEGENPEEGYEVSPETFTAAIVRNCMIGVAAGNGYYPTGLCCQGQLPLYVIVNGQNLFETIVFSLPRYANGTDAEKDIPLWEREYRGYNADEMIANGEFGPLSSLLFPTVGVRFGDIVDGAVKTVCRKPLFNKDSMGSMPAPGHTKTPTAFLEENGNIVKRIRNDKGIEKTEALRYNPSSDPWTDLLSTDYDVFGKNGLEASKFISEAFADGLIETKTKFTLSIYGLQIAASKCPVSGQYMSEDIHIPEMIISDKGRYAVMKGLVKVVSKIGDKLEWGLTCFERDKPETDHKAGPKQQIAQTKQMFLETERDRMFGPDDDWMSKIATNEITDDFIDELVSTVRNDAMAGYDSYQTNRKYFILKNRHRNYLNKKIKEELSSVFDR